MSLNWQMPENSSKNVLAYKTRYKGKEDETMHPILHRLIFLTMRLCADLDGSEKDKQDVKRRMDYIRLTDPELVTLGFGSEANQVEVWDGEKWVGFVEHFKPTKRFNQDGKMVSWEVVITDEWIDKYWGLSTNADRKTFTKWFTHYNKVVLDVMERNR
jgi:hypothetical protein